MVELQPKHEQMEQVEQAARRLRETILAQLGLGTSALLSLTLGCSARPPIDSDEGGVTTDPSTSANDEAMDGAEGMDSAGDMTGDSGPSDTTSDGGPIKLDVPSDPPLCSASFHSAESAAAAFPTCEFAPLDPDVWAEYLEVCVELEAGQSCAELCGADGLCEGMENCVDRLSMIYEICGPFEIDGACCSLLLAEPLPPIGRPFCVDGELRLARVEALASPAPSPALARHWLETARGEHASVAAFARFAAALQAHAAPPALVADALAAARDELEHTRLALALASRFAGRSLELGALELGPGVLAGVDDLASVVRDAVIEGCVGETLAAHEAACLAAAAKDPEVAACLRRIADDEARHAALAWRFVAWALEQRPSLSALVSTAIGEALGPERALSAATSEAGLAWGMPDPALRRRWRELARTELIGPCTRALLATV